MQRRVLQKLQNTPQNLSLFGGVSSAAGVFLYPGAKTALEGNFSLQKKLQTPSWPF